MKVQGYKLDDLPFTAIFGVYGSYIGLIMNILCVLAQLFISISPVKSPFTVENFFTNMLAAPIVLILYLGWKIYKGTSIMRPTEMDLITGRRDLDLAALKREEMEERANWSIFKK